jgi:8-oxo-(d)GTP phosphatase
VKDAPIVAAGGLVIRPDPDGALRVLVAHRPRYDDWSLPKGKSDPGEHAEETAAREVEEETGVRAQVIAPLAQVEYRLPSGRHKIVRYFAMRHRDERDFAPNDEVDEIRWLTPGEAAELLSYDHDHTLVASNLHHLMSMGTVWLIRHAAAGDRSTWEGDDTRRPLTKKGHRQAQEIATAIAPHDVDAIYSSPYVRCRQTVEPLAARVGLKIEDSPHLAEGAAEGTTLAWLRGLGGSHVVACSHGDVIPAVLRRLQSSGVPVHSADGFFDVKKGSIWTLAIEDGEITSATYAPPPEV